VTVSALSPSLGINTNCANTPPTNCGNTGDGNRLVLRASRARRFSLQTVAKDVLRTVPHPHGSTWRTVKCLTVPNGDGVSIRYTPEIQRASFVGACVCGSVWVCPVCSARISELRRVELAAMHATHAAAGGCAYMLTLTVPHAKGDRLADLLGRRREGSGGLADAVNRFRCDRTAKRLLSDLERVGFVRATEITHGANGWHPHFHELWFCITPARLHHARELLLSVWQRACGNAGLSIPNARGVDLREAWDASAYLAKIGHEQTWSAARELVTAGTKRGRSGSRNAWQLLDAAGQGDRSARSAFAEFACATLGQRQLIASKGLRPAMGVADRSDDELAQHVDESSYLIATIDAADWSLVLQLPGDARAALLVLAEDEGPEAVADFVSILRLDPSLALDFLGYQPDPHAACLTGRTWTGDDTSARIPQEVLP